MNRHVDSYLKEAVENVEERFDGYPRLVRISSHAIEGVGMRNLSY